MRVEAYDGDGDEYARWVMLRKLAPSYRQMMVNTADSSLMNIFNEFNSETPDKKTQPSAEAINTSNQDESGESE
tara:strand:+ start:34 stop:255 length:222 start_codon:yes stop_codon:yes gene_type:complete